MLINFDIKIFTRVFHLLMHTFFWSLCLWTNEISLRCGKSFPSSAMLAPLWLPHTGHNVDSVVSRCHRNGPCRPLQTLQLRPGSGVLRQLQGARQSKTWFTKSMGSQSMGREIAYKPGAQETQGEDREEEECDQRLSETLFLKQDNFRQDRHGRNNSLPTWNENPFHRTGSCSLIQFNGAFDLNLI